MTTLGAAVGSGSPCVEDAGWLCAGCFVVPQAATQRMRNTDVRIVVIFLNVFFMMTSIRYGAILAEKPADVIIIFLNMSEGEGYEKGRHSGRPLRC